MTDTNHFGNCIRESYGQQEFSGAKTNKPVKLDPSLFLWRVTRMLKMVLYAAGLQLQKLELKGRHSRSRINEAMYKVSRAEYFTRIWKVRPRHRKYFLYSVFSNPLPADLNLGSWMFPRSQNFNSLIIDSRTDFNCFLMTRRSDC